MASMESPVEFSRQESQFNSPKLTEDSAFWVRKAIGRQIDSACIVEQLPGDMSSGQLFDTAESIAQQVGFGELAGSIVRDYERQREEGIK